LLSEFKDELRNYKRIVHRALWDPMGAADRLFDLQEPGSLRQEYWGRVSKITGTEKVYYFLDGHACRSKPNIWSSNY
jgi:hypothetical protein